MKILSLDMATKTGWAIAENNKVIESGMQDFSKRRGESNGILFLKFRRWLSEMVELNKPEVIAYERAHFRGGAATELCVGLQTRAQEIAAEKGIELAPYTTGEIKKFCGSGKADKSAVIKFVNERCGLSVTDDNEADAIAIVLLAGSEL